MKSTEINEYAAKQMDLWSYVDVDEGGVERFVLQFRGESVDDYSNLIVKRRFTKRPSFLWGRSIAWTSTRWCGVLDTERGVYYGLGKTSDEACEIAFRCLVDYAQRETRRLNTKPPKPVDREALAEAAARRRKRTFPMLEYAFIWD